MLENNHSLSRIFREMAAMYRYLGEDERFRALAYNKAARVIDSLTEDIKTLINKNEVKSLPGIAEKISAKIVEFIDTGKIQKYEELKKQVPFELLELLNVSGFGPKALHQIHDMLGINTKDDVIEALQNGSLRKLKQFGARKTENMLRGLKLYKFPEERMLLCDALKLGNEIIQELKEIKGIIRMELAGSIRRCKETIGDIDILISCKPADRKRIINEFTLIKECGRVLSKGDTKSSILLRNNNRQVDLRIVNENEWGAAILYFTGSKEHTIQLRKLARKKGLKLNEYGIFKVGNNKRVGGETEEEIYSLLGLKWMPPKLREDKGEIEHLSILPKVNG